MHRSPPASRFATKRPRTSAARTFTLFNEAQRLALEALEPRLLLSGVTDASPEAQAALVRFNLSSALFVGNQRQWLIRSAISIRTTR